MIKAEDLRIGDLVIVSEIGCMVPKGEVCKVVAIDSEKFFEEMNLKGCATLKELEVNCSISCGVWCKYLSPIPLTPQILEKNRFDVMYPEKCYNKFIDLPMDGLIRSLSIEYRYTEWKAFIKYSSLDAHVLLSPVNYVHELQHILWALGVDANLKI